MNVPTYAHKASPEVVPHYRVVAQGPIRAIIEARLDDWNLDGDVVGLRALYTIDAGESHVRCHVEATPVKMRTGLEYEVGFGIRQIPAESVTASPGHVIVTGRQNQRDGAIGLGLYYDPQAFRTPTIVQTEDGGNHALVLRKSFVRVKWYLQTTRGRGRGAVAGSRTFARSRGCRPSYFNATYQSENFVSPKLRSPTSSKPKHNNMVSAFQ